MRSMTIFSRLSAKLPATNCLATLAKAIHDIFVIVDKLCCGGVCSHQKCAVEGSVSTRTVLWRGVFPPRLKLRCGTFKRNCSHVCKSWLIFSSMDEFWGNKWLNQIILLWSLSVSSCSQAENKSDPFVNCQVLWITLRENEQDGMERSNPF